MSSCVMTQLRAIVQYSRGLRRWGPYWDDFRTALLNSNLALGLLREWLDWLC